MFDSTENTGTISCSFCGKTQDQVKKIVAGPGVYICNECIDLCKEIIDEELNEAAPLDLDNIPTPVEMLSKSSGAASFNSSSIISLHKSIHSLQI